MLSDRVEQLWEVAPRGVTVRKKAITAGAAQQLIERHSGSLGPEILESDVDRGDRGHRDRPTAPVGAPVQELPGVFDPVGVPANSSGMTCSRR
jgi:hypothetical protein